MTMKKQTAKATSTKATKATTPKAKRTPTVDHSKPCAAVQALLKASGATKHEIKNSGKGASAITILVADRVAAQIRKPYSEKFVLYTPLTPTANAKNWKKNGTASWPFTYMGQNPAKALGILLSKDAARL
jgi:hypothetical protein